MKHYKIIFALLVLAFMSGCSMKYPLNATEFRQMLPGSMFGEVENVEVKRSLAKVGKSFKKKAKACLHKTLQTESCMNNGYGYHCSIITTH